MQKMLTTLMLLLMSGLLFSQSLTNQSSLLTEQYLQKSKHKKRRGQIILGTGAVMIVSGLIVAATGENDLRGLDNQIIGGSLLIGGAGLSLVSVFIFESSRKYKEKAATLSLQMQKAVQPYQHTLVLTAIPALVLKITL